MQENKRVLACENIFAQFRFDAKNIIPNIKLHMKTYL